MGPYAGGVGGRRSSAESYATTDDDTDGGYDEEAPLFVRGGRGSDVGVGVGDGGRGRRGGGGGDLGGGGGGGVRGGGGGVGGGRGIGRGIGRDGGRRGCASSTVRSRASVDEDEELLAAERRANAWLTAAVLGLVTACGFLLYDGARDGIGAAGHALVPVPSSYSGGVGAGDGSGDDDDWYDDKFQRVVPTKAKKASPLVPAKAKKAAAKAKAKKAASPQEARSSGYSGGGVGVGVGANDKPDAKELLERVYATDDDGVDADADGGGDGISVGGLHAGRSAPAAAPAAPPEAAPNVAAEAPYRDESSLSAESYGDEAEGVDYAESSLARLSPYASWDVPFRPGVDLPVYWHVPMSAGTTLEDILTHCHGLVEANEIGVTGGHGDDAELGVVTTKDGGRYVNVDTTTREGLERAGKMGLAESGLADVVMTPYLYEAASSLFGGTSVRGRCLTVLRHPVERAVAMFYYLSSHSSPDSPFTSMSIEEYAAGPLCEENWMVRFLADRPAGTLRWHHLDLAKDVLGRKCVVGLTDRFEESLGRFERYFGWGGRAAAAAVGGEELRGKCESRLVSGGDNVHSHPVHAEGSEAWELLKKKNGYDLMLYEYARELFDRQAPYVDDDRGL